jgi:hypothetical protein
MHEILAEEVSFLGCVFSGIPNSFLVNFVLGISTMEL